MARSFGKPDLTKQQAMVQLKLMLANATDQRLAAMTADELTRMYRVPIREIECTLLACQATRRREIAERDKAA